jgi:membrane-bound serine protease (ClpP class)
MIASLISALYLADMVPAGDAVTFLYIYGGLLLLAEITVVSFGMLFLNALLAFYVAYTIQTGTVLFFGVPLEWPLVFGIAFTELLMIALCVYMLMKHRRLKVTTGTESMIGHEAFIQEWNGKTGNVLVQGEPWKAYADKPLNLQRGDAVRVEAVEGLKVKITP